MFSPQPRTSVTRAPKNNEVDVLSGFLSEDACLEFIKEARWPGGITRCVKCRDERKHHRVNGRKAYACSRCGNHIYPLRGTAFEKSSTPLPKWFYAMALMASTPHQVTAKRIQHEIGVTYKTAWRMRRQIRIAIDSYERQQPARALEAALATRAATGDRTLFAALLAPSSPKHPSLSQEVTCLDGIDFISDFLRGYLRMCRDV